MKSLTTAVLSMLFLVSCASSPVSEEILAHQKDREALIEHKGEFQAATETTLYSWMKKVDELKSTPKKAPTKAADIHKLESAIGGAMKDLAKMRQSDVNDFQERQSEIDSDLLQIKQAYEKLVSEE
jgi:hypothetical protein